MTKQKFETALQQLTPRIREVLELFLAGKSYRVIAQSLYIGGNTVRQYMMKVYQAFGLENSSGLPSQKVQLIALFAQYKPELLHKLTVIESQNQVSSIITASNTSISTKQNTCTNEYDPNFIGRDDAISPIDEHINLSRDNLFVNLMAYDDTWVGRQNTIQNLKQKIITSSRIVILTGITGIGKTALAEKLYTELTSEKNWNQLLRVNFDNQDQSDFGSFVTVTDRWLQECGILVTPEDRQDIPRLQKKLIDYVVENCCLIIIDSLEWILKGNQEYGWSEFKDREWVNFFRLFLSQLY
ncbi:MAG: hypothetical protein EAZ87_04050 [Nostocales cyanobacterium]|nr:MAG: hypothetical protein EAZ87_04050 [Nostocales cyanobacterium]